MLIKDDWLSSITNMCCFNFQSEDYADYVRFLGQETLQNKNFITLKLQKSPNSILMSSRPTLKVILQMRQFLWKLGSSITESISPQIRSYSDSDFHQIVSLAENTFTLSRFHRDPRLGINMAEIIKKKWVLNNLTCRENCINLVYEDFNAKKIFGFISMLCSDSSLTIDLIGVAGSSRNQGVGTQLITASQILANDLKVNLRVGTQSNNPAISLYKKLGFADEKEYFVLHDIFEFSPTNDWEGVP